MKKLLACVLALSFCTADARFWQKLKNKIKGTSNQQTQQVDEIGSWLSNVQGVVSNMIADVQVISNNVVSWEIQSAVTSLTASLSECSADPFKIFANKSAIDEYISVLQGKKTETTKDNTQSQVQTVDVSQLLSDYQNLTNIITSYNTTYANNLNNMLTPAKNIQAGWSGNPEIAGYAGQLISALEACKSDSTKASSYLDAINQYVFQLSTKLGSGHVYITTLNSGIAYLQTHIELQQRSLSLSSATAANNTTSTMNYANKLSTLMNAVKTIQNQKSNSSTTTGTTTATGTATATGTTNTSTNGGVNYQNLINTGMSIYNTVKSSASGTAQ